jgi:hypothetical protein
MSKTLNQLEAEAIERALAETSGFTEAAMVLGVGRRTLYRKMKEYGMSPRSEAAKPLAAPREWEIQDAPVAFMPPELRVAQRRFPGQVDASPHWVPVIEKSAYDAKLAELQAAVSSQEQARTEMEHAIAERNELREKIRGLEFDYHDMTIQRDELKSKFELSQSDLINSWHEGDLLYFERHEVRKERDAAIAERDVLEAVLQVSDRAWESKTKMLGDAHEQLDAALALLREAREALVKSMSAISSGYSPNQDAGQARYEWARTATVEALTRIDESGILSKEEK